MNKMADLHQSSWTWNNFFLGFENQYLNPLSSQTQTEKETDWACAHNDDLMLLLLDGSTHFFHWDGGGGYVANFGFVSKGNNNVVKVSNSLGWDVAIGCSAFGHNYDGGLLLFPSPLRSSPLLYQPSISNSRCNVRRGDVWVSWWVG